MSTRWALISILVLYGMMGLAYAWLTPLWETPDEPAHYNYVRYLIEHRRFPMLQSSDYDFDYLERLKAARFPEEMSIDPIRYEYHQPPLYYLSGAVVAAPLPEPWRPMALRFFSVALGAVSLFVMFRVGIEIFPRQPFWALGATAFAATVPMRVAMTAAINNDTLAELFIALVLLALVRRVMRNTWSRQVADWRSDLSLGLLLGLGLVTKTTTYITIPLTAIVILGPAVIRKWQPETGPSGEILHFVQNDMASLARVLGMALLVGLPWFVRNSMVYGGLDILGLVRHNAIMLEQPHTAEWLSRLGWAGLAKEFVVTTFRSFWAQFGWMGILVDERIYLALALLCALAGLGFVLFLLRDFGKLAVRQRLCLGLLALSFLFTFIAYLWYNIQFVQHQGRYLFPALVPISIFFALGVWTLLDRAYASYLALLLGAGTLSAGLWGWRVGQIDKWLLALLGGAALLFGVRWFLPPNWRAGLYTLLFLGLWILDAVCLFAFIVPYFG